MFRRRRPPRESPDLPVRQFLYVLEVVERAKASMVEAVPSARAPGRPLADALFAFETDLREASGRMASWRTGKMESEWVACEAGLDQALNRSERLKLDAPELGFESLIGAVGELIAPLDPFEAAAARFRELGASLR